MISDAVVLALVSLLGTMVGVVIWLIKLNAERAAKAQQALTDTLNQTIANQRDQITTYGTGFTQLTDTMKSGFSSVSDGRNDAIKQFDRGNNAILDQLGIHAKALDTVVAALATRRESDLGGGKAS